MNKCLLCSGSRDNHDADCPLYEEPDDPDRPMWRPVD